MWLTMVRKLELNYFLSFSGILRQIGSGFYFLGPVRTLPKMVNFLEFQSGGTQFLSGRMWPTMVRKLKLNSFLSFPGILRPIGSGFYFLGPVRTLPKMVNFLEFQSGGTQFLSGR